MQSAIANYFQVIDQCLHIPLSTADADVCKTYVQVAGNFARAGGAIIGAIIIGIAGGLITLYYNIYRARQDRESQWRQHAIELTKLDLERRLRSRALTDANPLRPGILDFLANYRDLSQLGKSAPGTLYDTIRADRISASEFTAYNPNWLSYALELTKLDEESGSIGSTEGQHLVRVARFLEYYTQLDELASSSPAELLKKIDGQKRGLGQASRRSDIGLWSRLKKLTKSAL